MKKKKSIKKEVDDLLAEKIEANAKDFQQSMRDIEPFIKKSNTYSVSTAGKWQDASTISDFIIARQ
jgi:hypothetical protein